MNMFRRMVSVALVFALAGMSLLVQAQRPYRAGDRDIERVLSSIETRTNTFRSSLDTALDNSRYNSTRREDNINQFVRDFADATNLLRNRFNNRRAVNSDVENVLNRAATIDNFMNRNRLGVRVESDWANLRSDLSELARLYNISWNWSGQTAYPPYGQTYPPANQGKRYNPLTGTYRLDVSRSDDPRTAAERASRNMPVRDRQRTIDNLTERLEAPDMIAIDRNGRSVAIASTRAPQITFDADGTTRTEQLSNGRTVRVRASLSGDNLIISSTGDRGSDFNVTFEPYNAGRQLRITRRINTDQLSQAVTVVSVYDRTSDVAQLDLYEGGSSGYPDNGTVSGDFIVPDGTTLIATLNDNLSTKDSRDNDRFTMTVQSPSQYQGATIEGYVTGVNRSGRITGRSEMVLNFDTIRMRNGRSYKFAGFTESVRTANGETVKVDNEGSVKEGDSRTTTTAKRAAIGTAVGAIIGAIAGGGKGAAIGAVIGAGAGAGSVYVQGSDDLELASGSEVTLRASAPNR